MPMQQSQPIQQMQQNQPMQQNSYNQQSSIIWVQGESGAKSYLVAPNSTVQLWDSESQTIYIKSADASGMPSIKILDYTIRDNEKSADNVITQAKTDNSALFEEEITQLNSKIDLLESEIRQLKEDIVKKSSNNHNYKQKKGAKLNE
jgi:vacuolar-type H+-ATPase subunit H